MRKILLTIAAAVAVASTGFAQKTITVKSPDGKIGFVFRQTPEQPLYSISYNGRTLVGNGMLGFEFDSGYFGRGLTIGRVETRKGVEKYDLIVGKASHVESPFREAVIPMIEKDAPGRRIDLVVRAFDDGVAFRYVFPGQEGWDSYVMYDELTTFDVEGDPMTLSMPLASYTTSHEGLYDYVNWKYFQDGRLLEMPTLFEFSGGTFMAITEAAVRDYAGMYLMKEDGRLKARLSPWPGQERVKVRAGLPHRSPWRVFMISDKVGDVMRSNILTDLNDPCAIEDTSWIRPGKTTFTWWNGNMTPDTLFMPGNNFMTNKYYIDFASRAGLEYHSVYGYAEQPWYVDENMNFGVAGDHTDVTRTVRTIDMKHISDYADSKGVGIHVWVHWEALYRQIDEALDQWQKWGIDGMMVDFMDRDDQEMIRIQEEILRKAAEHRMFIQFHGSSKPSGMHRTYPNEFTREGTRNYECYKWSDDMGADRDIPQPFSRVLAGAADYHLGGFRAVPKSEFRIQYTHPLVTGTRCHMLAMYVIMESYLGMVCDTPYSYEGQPGFEFIQKLPTVWDEMAVPEAKVMEYAVVARRKGSDWYVGALNNSRGRTVTLDLAFLDKDAEYTAEIYADAPDTDTNPNNLVKTVRTVRRGDRLDLRLNDDGGSVLRICKK